MSAWNVGDPGSIPGLGRSPGEGNSHPLQYSGLENPMEGGDQGSSNTSITWKLVRNANSQILPRLSEAETQGVGSNGLLSPPGVSNPH